MPDVDVESTRLRADARAWAASGEASVAEVGQRLTSAMSAAVFLRAPDSAAVVALLLLQGPTAEASEHGYANSVAAQLGGAAVAPEGAGQLSRWKRAHRGVQLVSMARRVAGVLLGGVKSEEKTLTTQLFANALLMRVGEPLRLVELLMQQGADPEEAQARGVKTRAEWQAYLDGLGVEAYNEHTQLSRAVERAFAAAGLNEQPLPPKPLFRLAYALKDASWDHRSDVALLMAVLGCGEVNRWHLVGAGLGRGARACRARWFERWWSAEKVASLQYPPLEISRRPQRFLGTARGQQGEEGEGGGGAAALDARLKAAVSACEAAQAKRTEKMLAGLVSFLTEEECARLYNDDEEGEEEGGEEGDSPSLQPLGDTSEDEGFVRQLQARFDLETRLRKQGWNTVKLEAVYSSVQHASKWSRDRQAVLTKHWTPTGELKPPPKGSQDGNDRPFQSLWHLLQDRFDNLGRQPPGV